MQVDKRRNRLHRTLHNSLDSHLESLVATFHLKRIEVDGGNHSIDGDLDSRREFEVDVTHERVFVAALHLGIVQLGRLQGLDAVAELRLQEHQEALDALLWGYVGMRRGDESGRATAMTVVVVVVGGLGCDVWVGQFYKVRSGVQGATHT
jgi:hypothetical protein